MILMKSSRNINNGCLMLLFYVLTDKCAITELKIIGFVFFILLSIGRAKTKDLNVLEAAHDDIIDLATPTSSKKTSAKSDKNKSSKSKLTIFTNIRSVKSLYNSP